MGRALKKNCEVKGIKTAKAKRQPMMILNKREGSRMMAKQAIRTQVWRTRKMSDFCHVWLRTFLIVLRISQEVSSCPRELPNLISAISLAWIRLKKLIVRNGEDGGIKVYSNMMSLVL